MITACVLPTGLLLVAVVVFLSRKAEAKRLAGDWPANARIPGA